MFYIILIINKSHETTDTNNEVDCLTCMSCAASATLSATELHIKTHPLWHWLSCCFTAMDSVGVMWNLSNTLQWWSTLSRAIKQVFLRMSLCLNGGEPSLGCIISPGTGFEINCCILEAGSLRTKARALTTLFSWIIPWETSVDIFVSERNTKVIRDTLLYTDSED